MGTSTHRGIVQQLLGICATQKADPGCWRFAGGRLVIELSRAAQLSQPGGAIRIEKSRGLPTRVLVFRDADGKLRAMENKCSHAGRRLDPDGSAEQLQCCSVGRSRFDLDGHALSGFAKKDVRFFSVEEHDGRLLVDV